MAPLAPSTEVGAAIRAACDRLGRPFPEAAVAALQDNWYNTAAELTALPDDTARSLGVPLRLKAEVAQLLAAAAAPAADGGSSGGSSASDGLVAGVPLPAQAEQLLDDLLDGSSDGSESDADSSSSSVEAAAAQTAAAAAEAAAWDQAHLPIEERRCPPLRRFGNRAKDAPTLTSRAGGRTVRYALSADEISAELADEFERFHRFLTVRFFGMQVSWAQGRAGWRAGRSTQGCKHCQCLLGCWSMSGRFHSLLGLSRLTTPQSDPISDVTARKYADHMRGLLGWYVEQTTGAD